MIDLWLAALLDSSLKGLALCLAAAGVAFSLRRASAAVRHLVWRLAFLGLLALPALAMLLPEWQVPVPQIGPHINNVGAELGVSAPEAGQGQTVAVSPPRALTPALSQRERVQNQFVGSRGEAKKTPSQRAGVRAQAVVLGLWLAGVVAVLLPLGIAFLRVGWLHRRARPVEDPAWIRLLDRVRADLKVRSPVELIVGDDRAMPMTWGWRRPVVLLPAGAETWPAPRRRAVLLHELAHVARGDFLTQLAAEVARALYWFNPLVWRAVRRLRIESEHACDDQVITAGAPAAEYAGDLLEIARSLRAGRSAAPAALAMARPSEMAGRLLAVLDARRSRRGVSRRLALPAWLAASCVVLPLAALSPGAPPDPPKPPKPPKPPAQSSSSSWFGGDWFAGFVKSVSEIGTSTYEWRDDGHRIRIRTKGTFDLTDDWTGIARLSRGAEMRFEEEKGRTERRLDVEPGSGGRPVYTWKVDGEKRPFDAEGRRWLQAMLLHYIRHSGDKAEERVAWILKRKGPEGVLAEVSQIDGDYGKRIYLVELFEQSRLEPALVERAFRQAGREIESDYELRQALVAALDRQAITEPAALAYTEATREIESDYEARQTLSPLVYKARHNARTLSALLRAAGEIESDYELAELLQDVAGEHTLSGAAREAYVQAMRSLGSEYERKRAEEALARRGRGR